MPRLAGPPAHTAATSFEYHARMPEQRLSTVQRAKATAGGFWAGFALPARAANVLLRNRGVKRYAVLPLIVNALVYFTVFALFIWFLLNWQVPQVGPWDFWGGFGAWLADAVNWAAGTLKWLLLVPLFFIISYFTFTMVGMIIASPFNDMLSEKTEQVLTHPRQAAGLPLKITARAMVTSLFDTIVILLWQLLFTVLVLPLLIVPVIGWVPLFLVTAYFTGLGFIDISMARNYLRNRHKKPAVRLHRASVFGLGMAMELLFMVPFVGLLMLPLGVVAGTILYCRTDWNALLAEHKLDRPVGFEPPVIAGGGGGTGVPPVNPAPGHEVRP
jgi:CysZ protein